MPRDGILARQAHRIAFVEQRAEGERLGSRPVETLAGFEHLAPWLPAGARWCGADEILRGVVVSARPTSFSSSFAHRRRAAAVAGRRCGKSGPAAVQPVGPVGVKCDLRASNSSSRRLLECGHHRLDIGFGDRAFADQLLRRKASSVVA